MRKLSAHFLFTLQPELLKNGILVLDDNMLVSEIIDTNGRLTEMDRLEFHNGILIPGFDGLTIELLMKLQSEMSESNLNQIFKSIFPEKEAGFELGKKADVWLISSLDLQNLRLTAKK